MSIPEESECRGRWWGIAVCFVRPGCDGALPEAEQQDSAEMEGTEVNLWKLARSCIQEDMSSRVSSKEQQCVRDLTFSRKETVTAGGSPAKREAKASLSPVMHQALCRDTKQRTEC